MTKKQIIKGCQKGDRACQRALVERYSRMLLSIARRYIGDDHRAQDILQEAYIRVFKHIKGYRTKTSFEGWLRTIVINLALNDLDKAVFRREVNGFKQLPSPILPPDIYQQLHADELMLLVQKLPEGYRQVFNLAIIEGYKHDEIGSMLGISASSSRSQLARARAKLQTMILQCESYSYVSK